MVRRAGTAPDVTLVTYGGMLPVVEQIRDELTGEELSIDVVAPALLNPMPTHQLVRHLIGCEAVVVVEEAYAEVGFGCALGAALLEAGFRGRFSRVSPPPVPIPAARSLETTIVPGRSRIVDSVRRVLGL
jgi:2-oxoisovalerate dehydrogenase E1 component